MPIIRIRLSDGALSGVSQILLTEPEKLLRDGRIIPFLSKLSDCTGGGSCAWELLMHSVSTSSGVRLCARLITHTRLPHGTPAQLESSVTAAQEKQLAALAECGIAAEGCAERLPPAPRAGLVCLSKRTPELLPVEAALEEGQLLSHLCVSPGNGFSLLLVRTQWQQDELDKAARSISAERRAQLAREALFCFAVTFWGPDAQVSAAWLQGVTLNTLAPFLPAQPQLYPLCMRSDPWKMLTLLPGVPDRPAVLTLSELLTCCGCPAEPGEMQRMCRTSWRDDAREAFTKARLPLLSADLTLQSDDLVFLGLGSSEDLTRVLGMSDAMAEMLRMCVMILRQLGVLHTGRLSDGEGNPLMRYLLPTVGHIYEQLVRECCYHTMYSPYYAYATGRRPRQITGVILSTYDQGPDCKYYTLQQFPGDMRTTEIQSRIRDRMIDDFADHALQDGRKQSDVYWYHLFNDMNTARCQRNEMAHEAAGISTAAAFAHVFLLDRPGEPSLLRRLLDCRRVEACFPQR